MVLTKQFGIGLLLGLSLAACAGASFPYKYYGVDLAGGALRGPTVQDDLPLAATCDATSANDSPCTAMLTADFLTLKQAYLDQEVQLNNCQQSLASK